MRSTIIFSALFLLVVGIGSAKAQSDKPDSSRTSSSSAQASPQSPPQSKPAETTQPNVQIPQDKPLGAAGASRDKRKPSAEDAEFMVIRDRWRIGVPEDPRFSKGDILNPYRQNVLKGDYPIIGNNIFMNISLASESDFTVRRIPVPQDVSSERPGSFEFFGRGRQEIFNQNFIFSMDLFKGDASFKPVDWRFKVTGIANFNLLNVRERGITNIDVRRGTLRRDGFNSIEEVFFEYRLGDTTKILPFLRGKGSQAGRSPEFDTTSVRVGIQPFTSDFRGFIFSDSNLGARLFGNFKNNRWQYNLAYFHMLEKETNSGLNTINFAETDFRNQQVYIANIYRQDTFVKGYTTQFSLHYNDDRPTTEYDQNGFLVRPARIGRVTPHRIRSGYFGWTGDGHFGRMNITHAAYQVIGRDTFNQIANRATRINAQMAAAELSIDYDYIRYRVGAFYSSGDSKPLDDTGRGFDAILDNTSFAGGKFSFWNSQALRLTQTGVALVEPRSLIPSLRSSKIQGQANFVNPGLTLYNAGIDVDVTPKLRGFLNYNYLRFNRTEPLELALFQPAIRHEIGHDLGVGFIYRPLLNENIVIVGGASGLRPGVGFTDIFSSNCNGLPRGCGAGAPTLWAAFVTVKFVY
ncbi:MAG: hypothetical protein JNK38_02135 [Acidobacteria bacterium]|nr:hypothetical protein [Acidobacteriota bacterium]